MNDRTCAVEGCAKPVKKRSTLCSGHAHRKQRYGSPTGKPVPKVRVVRMCDAEGCERKHYGKGWCALHYGRLLSHGDALWEPPKRPDVCVIEGCDRPVGSREWCGNHYALWRRNGDPTAFAPSRREDVAGQRFGRLVAMEYDVAKHEWACRCDCGARTFASIDRLKNGKAISCGTPGPCRWRSETPTYRAMHARIERERGKARSHRCVDCEAEADSWSYDHADPREHISDAGGVKVPYSVDISHYEPRCRSCHVSFDRYDQPWLSATRQAG